MDVQRKKITFSNYVEIPIIGLGTARIENCEETVFQAISNGYRLIDTAEEYGNEKEIGYAIKNATDKKIVKRENLFIISKLSKTYHTKPEECVSKQLRDLDLDYIDLYLIHKPCNQYFSDSGEFEKVPLHILWAKLESLVEKGLIKSLGVSNFNVQLLLDLFTYCKIKPIVNEVEYHPYLVQQDLKDFCEKQGIKLIGYNSRTIVSSVTKNSLKNQFNLLEEEIIVNIAKKYNKTCWQVYLNWMISQNIIVVPKTSNFDTLKEYLESDEFLLEEEEILKISSLNKNLRFMNTNTSKSYGYVNIFA